MGSEQQSKSPSTRRYTPAEKEQAIRLVRQLRNDHPPLAGHLE